MMLGNLNVEQIEKRLGIDFPEKIKELMKNTRQDNAQFVQKGKWHCFDIPFNIVCGDIEIATEIFEALKPFSEQCKCQLQFSLQG